MPPPQTTRPPCRASRRERLVHRLSSPARRSADRPARRRPAGCRSAAFRRPRPAAPRARRRSTRWTISRRSVVQRCPRCPRPKTRSPARPIPGRPTARRSMALLPPSSSSERPSRAATVWATARPIGTQPVAEISGSRRSASQGLAHVRTADHQAAHARRHECQFGRRFLEQCLASQRRERRFLRRLPHHGVAAHQRDHRVPRPHGHGKIERRDHAHRPQRVPLLHHAMAGPLAWRSCGRKVAGSAPRQSRRCRSSPALRRGLPRRSCPPPRPRAMPDRRAGLSAARRTGRPVGHVAAQAQLAT